MQVRIEDVRINARYRPLRPEEVERLASSIESVGLLNPITVADLGEGFDLIAGLHRLKACESLGWEDIEATVVELDGLGAQLAEIDENLVRAELTKMERDEHLARRKQIYEMLYPDTKHGAVGNGREKSRQLGDSTPARFTQDAAEKTGMSERSVQRSVARVDAIPEDVRDSIRGTPIADNGAELDALSKMEPEQQREAVAKVQAGEAKTVRDAVSEWSKEELVLKERFDAGETVVISLRTHTNLRNYAESLGRYTRIDRRSEWGNPHRMSEETQRGEIIERYRRDYLPGRPDLVERIPELKGHALGCWCAPWVCHGDTLAMLADGQMVLSPPIPEACDGKDNDCDEQFDEVDAPSGCDDEAPAKPETAMLLLSSDSNEWHTPQYIIDLAREVMGGIDLDPASCEAANAVVQAETFYTEAQDGLSQPWFGRIWLNPPYGKDGTQSNAGKWSGHLIEEYSHPMPQIEQAILLVNACIGREWFNRLWTFPICFPYKRIKYWQPGRKRDQPTFGNAIAYLGPNIDEFAELFGTIGRIVLPSEDDISISRGGAQ